MMHYNNIHRICFVTFAATCLIFSSYLFRSSKIINEISHIEEENLKNIKCELNTNQIEKFRCLNTPIPRLNQYCASKVVKGVEGGIFAGSEYWSLTHLVFTIRHGDRSPIHNLPGSSKININASDSNLLIDPEASINSFKLRSFKLEIISKDLKSSLHTVCFNHIFYFVFNSQGKLYLMP